MVKQVKLKESDKELLKCICSNYRMYLSKLQNVFVIQVKLKEPDKELLRAGSNVTVR